MYVNVWNEMVENEMKRKEMNKPHERTWNEMKRTEMKCYETNEWNACNEMKRMNGWNDWRNDIKWMNEERKAMELNGRKGKERQGKERKGNKWMTWFWHAWIRNDWMSVM